MPSRAARKAGNTSAVGASVSVSCSAFIGISGTLAHNFRAQRELLARLENPRPAVVESAQRAPSGQRSAANERWLETTVEKRPDRDAFMRLRYLRERLYVPRL